MDLRLFLTSLCPSEENRSRGAEDDGGVSRPPPAGGRGRGRGSTPGPEEGEWNFRGYTRMRGSREVVSGTKSTCSGLYYIQLGGADLIKLTSFRDLGSRFGPSSHHLAQRGP